eukprot:CAMPEP_0171810506 /NCGR_PEP_ID=MMETSP0991-20121206/77596_1 /TAXON_ID=483369 /ORGANISM="non described non described, Strain CCMP2098" /LENGTH=127 /DNA_ID=CAMNT_0012423781 /DNA_START=1391 /DNA_END=1775 /DNA_ORIENTATION=+
MTPSRTLTTSSAGAGAAGAGADADGAVPPPSDRVGTALERHDSDLEVGAPLTASSVRVVFRHALPDLAAATPSATTTVVSVLHARNGNRLAAKRGLPPAIALISVGAPATPPPPPPPPPSSPAPEKL